MLVQEAEKAKGNDYGSCQKQIRYTEGIICESVLPKMVSVIVMPATALNTGKVSIHTSTI